MLSVEGGADTYFGLTKSCLVTSYDSIRENVVVNECSAADRGLISELSGIETNVRLTMSFMSSGFFRGQGVPCPVLFDSIKGAFIPQTVLEGIDSPAYRSRLFCRAATGQMSNMLGNSTIQVSILLHSPRLS